ncbi:MAG: hypothetical protein OES47_01430, partial [Acidobacteriota bacterium]|nr:hypothetical protein [Acidobacteriota bacterium]
REYGKWGVILGGTRRGRRVTPQPEGRGGSSAAVEAGGIEPTQDVGSDRNRAGGLSRQGPQSSGPISGVRPLTEEEAVKTFMDSNKTNEWNFTADIIPVVPTGLLVDIVPRLNSRTIGRPFPEGVKPGIAAGPVKQKTKKQQPQGNQRNRNDRRNRRNRRNPNKS